MRPFISAFASLLTCLSASIIPAPAQADIQSTDYPSLQAAIDANPGSMIYVPNGDHLLTETIMVTTTGTGLCGPGRLVMTDASKDIINVREANDVTIRDLKLFRERGKHDGGRNGIFAAFCEGLTIDGVSVTNNCGENAGLKIEHCMRLAVRNCLVRDYKAMTLDDRTRNPQNGTAFKCVDGNGMKFMDCKGAQITNNRIIETVFRATKHNRDKYDLGKVTIIPETPGRYTPKGLKENPYTSNWHQGAAVFFGEQGEGSVLSGNYIENAAQGFDIHADYVTVTGNIVNGALVGAKALAGSKHIIISNNQFRRIDLYGVLLGSGPASHYAVEASGNKPAKDPNLDGGTVIMGNIISDYGFGDQYWSTGSSPGASLYAISLEEDRGAPGAPPVRDVIIANNVVYDTGRDKMIIDGRPQVVPPRYQFALMAKVRKASFETLKIHGNIFHPGSSGVSNYELPPQ
jgi:nitrous oxidase accessory protein NosD